MIKEEDILEQFTEEEDLREIINKLKDISFEDLIKHPHYEYSLLEKNTDENLVRETYSKFDLIRLVRKRVRPNKKISYDLYYEIEDKTFVVIVITFDTNPPQL